MMDFRYNYYYNYFQLLNKSLLRKKEFHIFLSIIDIAIILFKILNIYIRITIINLVILINILVHQSFSGIIQYLLDYFQ